MMRHRASLHLSAAIGASAIVFYAGPTSASDSESGVPLTISAENGQVSIERVTIRLNGRDVAIFTELNNETDRPQVVGFYAYTPLFNQLGEGEEYLDKSFADLRVSVQNRPKRINKIHKAYFLGRDITDSLLKLGLNPLPDLRAHTQKVMPLAPIEGVKPTVWQGSVIYSWADRMTPGIKTVQEVRYRDLPQFGLEDVESKRFSQRVQQHCGDPEAIRSKIKTINSYTSQVLIERHEFIVPYMAFREVMMEVTQPDRNWLGARPVITLVCGIRNPSLSANISGLLDAADQSLQVMTVSIVDNAVTDSNSNNAIHKKE
jgi:hypothetical protein